MIPITNLRSSSYNAHSMFPMNYFAEYILGWKGPANKKADMGTILHKVMEILAISKLGKQNGEIFTDEIIGSIPIDPEPHIVLEKVFEYYSNYFKTHDWTNKDKKTIAEWLDKVLTHDKGLFDPRNRHIISPEKNFDITIDRDWARYDYLIGDKEYSDYLKLFGTIDLITQIDNDTYEIIDWKTGKRLNWATMEVKEYEHLAKDPQLLIYFYAVSTLYPKIAHFVFTINFINDGGPYSVFFDRSQIPQIENMLKEKFEKIKNTSIPDANLSWKCSKFCNQRKTTFEGTEIFPIIESRPGQITPMGKCMSKCEQLRYVLDRRPIELVVQHMSHAEHTLGHYKKPGT